MSDNLPNMSLFFQNIEFELYTKKINKKIIIDKYFHCVFVPKILYKPISKL
jgi:hypothetical protein